MEQELTTITQYAAENGVSYQAVSQQIKRYSDKLEGHIIKQGKTRYLDEEAVTFLNQHRIGTKISVINSDNVSRIEQLESQNKALLTKIVELQDKAIKDKESYIALQDKYSELLAITTKKEEATDRKQRRGRKT